MHNPSFEILSKCPRALLARRTGIVQEDQPVLSLERPGVVSVKEQHALPALQRSENDFPNILLNGHIGLIQDSNDHQNIRILHQHSVNNSLLPLHIAKTAQMISPLLAGNREQVGHLVFQELFDRASREASAGRQPGICWQRNIFRKRHTEKMVRLEPFGCQDRDFGFDGRSRPRVQFPHPIHI